MDLYICRICGGAKDLSNISENDPEMVDKLSKCLNIHIDPTDALPKLICGQCMNDLEISYRLIKQSEKMQKLLRLKIEVNRSQNMSNEELELLPVSRQVYCNKLDGQVKAVEKTTESLITLNYNEKANKSYKQEDSMNVIKLPENDIDKDKILTVQNFEAVTERQNDLSDMLLIENKESKADTMQHDRSEIEECTIELLSSPPRSEESDASNNGQEYDINQENLYTCNTCQNVFSSKKQYINHIKEHGRERFQCIQCCKFFPTQYRLKRHEEVHTDGLIQQCPYCQRTYRVVHNLRRHIRSVHLNGKSFDCSVCNVSFSRKDVLKRHMLLHSDRKNYCCPLCSQSFKTKDYLNAHYKTRHENSVKKCKINKRITDGKKYQCGYCGKLFKSSFPYKNHILIHKNEKPYECETCAKKFRTIAALTTHQRIHDDYRPYQCDVCLKSFKQTSHLKEHKLLHLENVPQYSCSVCQSSFVKKSNLKAHMHIHATEKPFKCAECTAEFTFMHLLQQHANKVHNRTISKEYTAISGTVDLVESNENSDTYNEILDCDEIHFINTMPEESEIEGYLGENEKASSSQFDLHSENNLGKPEMSKEDNHENFIDCIHIDSSNSVQSLPSNELNNMESFCREEIHITEQKVEVFVNEES